MPNQKVVIFVPFVHAFGGVERLVVGLSRYLAMSSIEHTVLSFRDTIDLGQWVSWNVSFEQLRPTRNVLAEARALRDYLDRHAVANKALLFDLKSAFYTGICAVPPSVVHITDPPGLLSSDVSKAAWSARARSASPEPRRYTWPARLRGEAVHFLNRRGARRASHVLTTTRAIAGELEDLYGRDVEVVYPGVPAPALAGPTEVGRPRPSRRLLSVCRLEASKRIDWIIREMAQLDGPQRQNLFLDIVGEGPDEPRLRAVTSELGMESKVVFHGKLSDAALGTLFRRAALFMMPARQGYGLPALEALVRDVPAVIHRESGVSELIGGSPWVEIVESDESGLREAIDKMMAKIESGALTPQNKPTVPSELEWAGNIARICGWTPGTI
jgi:glycosyltransferase involved in cell wall biosynthesis